MVKLARFCAFGLVYEAVSSGKPPAEDSEKIV